jgi:hypothetical protein
MSPEEWKAHIHQWQQKGGLDASKTPDATDPPPDEGGGWLGTAKSFGTGMLREGAAQLPFGVAKDFAEGGDKDPLSAEQLGRDTADIAPSVALDLAVPEIGIVPTAMRGAKYIRPLINSAIKGGIGGGIASPSDRNAGAQTGAEVGVGGTVLGGALHSPVARSTLLPLVILAEMAQRGGMIPHEILPLAYPWAMAHAVSALGGLAQHAGKAIPATTGAAASRVQQGMDQGDGN